MFEVAEYQSNQGYKCKTYKYVNSREVWVIFENGHIDCFTKGALDRGQFRNKTLPSICNFGITYKVENPTSHPLYGRWKGMIERCYAPSHPAYKNYGAKGVTVCDRWRYFKSYIEDVSSMENYDLLINNPRDWEIDKDTSCGMLYSKDTCRIISKRENVQIANYKPIVAYYKNGTMYKEYSSLEEAVKDLKGTKENISRALRGTQKTGYGYIWKYKNEEDN